ncbi:protein tyrosine kinase [Necator americanus]|uniref:Protein tyrosine kinase n=1 Tax=Necator americanus TaxID=51031 RepID=W2T4H4_NECAM|nr:protein tyrosine kinase [Necator americanus]ETN76768.1 protein tyrosine kinase [Necator americanus]
MIVIIGTCAGAVLILIVATILYRQKYMWMEKLNRFRNHHRDDNADDEDEIIDYWEMSPEQVIVKSEQLGHGAYGQVYKGKLVGPSPGILRYYKSEIAQFTDCDCAVKMLPKYASDSARAEFMHEIELMKTLGCHDNIVCMLGCITAANKSCLVIEYCASRDLLRYLKLRKTDLEINKSIDEQIECTKEFLNFAWQIAQGMISDFGLSLSLDCSSQLPARGRLPIKWLALECLQRELFSMKSDVWSYGIVLFEMYSMGGRPFEDIEPLNLIAHLEAGNRPKRPLLATDKIAEVMTKCWDKVPGKRPSFEELLVVFASLLEQVSPICDKKNRWEK